jgi:hypothetical protein
MLRRRRTGLATIKAANSITEAVFVDAPRDADVQAPNEDWDGLRGGRAISSSQDMVPTVISNLLPSIIIVGDGGDWLASADVFVIETPGSGYGLLSG